MLDWFKDSFPQSERRYGPPLLLGEPNHDAWAFALQEGPARVVFCPAEETFYFFDRKFEAYRTVDPEERLQALVRALVRKATADLSIHEARQFCSLWNDSHVGLVISRAKVLLSIEPEFFTAPNGVKRIEPIANITYRIFAEKRVELQQGLILTAPDAYHAYFIFCQETRATPLRRMDFKQKFTDETLARWGIGLRNDLVFGEKPRTCQGWKNLTLKSVPCLN